MDLTDATLRARTIHPQVGSCTGEGCWGCEHLRSYFEAFRDAARADADREATKRMQIGSNIVLDAYKKHHEHFHSECSITGPGRPPDTGRTVK